MLAAVPAGGRALAPPVSRPQGLAGGVSRPRCVGCLFRKGSGEGRTACRTRRDSPALVRSRPASARLRAAPGVVVGARPGRDSASRWYSVVGGARPGRDSASAAVHGGLGRLLPGGRDGLPSASCSSWTDRRSTAGRGAAVHGGLGRLDDMNFRLPSPKAPLGFPIATRAKTAAGGRKGRR